MRCLIASLFVLIGSIISVVAAPLIVDQGTSNAQIVIGENPPRLAAQAALELRYYLQQISGAALPIVRDPAADVEVTIYVGESAYTRELGVTSEGLQDGAFRMVSGSRWLVLLGHDFDFEPTPPWPRTANDMRERALPAWDELTNRIAGRTWGYPYQLLWKAQWQPRNVDEIMAERYGAEMKHVWNPRDLPFSKEYQGPGAAGELWRPDQGGTFNAVCEYLRMLGVRWYMRGPLGTVIPSQPTIELPSIDRTVRPDFPIRCWAFYGYGGFSFDDIIWDRHLGMNSGIERLGNARMSHFNGHHNVHGRKPLQEAHPEYYALIGNKRDTHHRDGEGLACYRAEGLIDETVRYARFMYDYRDEPAVSIWPADGFKRCGCKLCYGKSASDLVWWFVDRVARELYETHPGRLVLCGAYTSYAEPPTVVEKFPPNVIVSIANRGRIGFQDPQRWATYWELIEGWRKLLGPGQLMRNENNRYTLKQGARGEIAYPPLHPRSMAQDLKALKGISIGERGETSQRKGQWHAPALDHLNLYVQSRLLWDVDQDIEALLDEYHRLFYGPVADPMQKAFDEAERNYNLYFRGTDLEKLQLRVSFLEQLHAARDTAGDTIYGQRIQAILDELAPLDEVREQLAKVIAEGDPRDDNPIITAAIGSDQDELEVHQLRKMHNGARPQYATSFTVAWEERALVVDIRCEEPDMDNLFLTEDVWTGDSVAILLETPYHRYYQLEVNADGTIFDADRQHGKVNRNWQSMAEVKPEKGEDYWRVTVRIPVVPVDEGSADPNHFVVGPQPTREQPWYMMVGRVRHRERYKAISTVNVSEVGYHDLDAFVRLVTDEAAQ